MCLFICLIPVTIWLAVAYAVYYIAKRSTGTQRAIGRLLCIWIVAIACCFLAFGIWMQFFAECPIEGGLGRMLSGRRPAPQVMEAPRATRPGW